MKRNKRIELNMKKNKNLQSMQSLIYCAILFEDMDTVKKLLHPQGDFLGMSKYRFLYFLQNEFNKKVSEFVSGDSKLFTVLIDIGKYAGKQCYILNRGSPGQSKPPAYVFLPYEHDLKRVGRIVQTNNYRNEKAFTLNASMFRKDKSNDFNLIFKN